MFLRFYECLCTSTMKSCHFSYKTNGKLCRGKIYCHSVLDVWTDKIHKHSSSFGSNVFVCEEPQLVKRKDEKISCHRNATKTCDAGTGFFKWEFFDNSCSSKCINLCWLGYDVSFKRESSRSVPESGQCETKQTAVSPTPVSGTDGELQPTTRTYTQSTAPHSKRHFTSPAVSLAAMFSTATRSYTNTIYTNAFTFENRRVEKNNQTGMTETHTVNSSEEIGDRLIYVIVWIAFACGLVASVAIAFVLILRCRRKRKDRKKTEVRRLSFTDIQPYACSGEENAEYVHHAEISPQTLDGNKTIGQDATYLECNSVYCTIADGDLTSAKYFAQDKAKDLGGNSSKRQGHQIDMAGMKIARASDVGGNVYSEPSHGNLKSAADVPKNILDTYNMPATEESEGPTAAKHDERIHTSFYNRLNSRGEMSPHFQGSLMEGYHTAAGVFEAVQMNQVGTKQPVTPAQSTCNNGEGETSKLLECRRCPQETKSTEYFELEDLADGHSVNGTSSFDEGVLTEHQVSEYFVLEENSKGSQLKAIRDDIDKGGSNEEEDKETVNSYSRDFHIYQEIPNDYEKTEYAELE